MFSGRRISETAPAGMAEIRFADDALTMVLPGSVKSAYGLPPRDTLPIACGELQER